MPVSAPLKNTPENDAGAGFQALTIKASERAAQLITDLKVSAPFDQKAPPDPLSPQVSTKALWDTGASNSVISHDLAKERNLTAVGATNVNHAGGISVSPRHLVNFYLPHGVQILGVLAAEFPAQPQFGAIIGMDVIGFGDLAITNVGGKTWMSFRTPSMVAIDYVVEFNKTLYAGVGRNAPCPCGSDKKFKFCHGQ